MDEETFDASLPALDGTFTYTPSAPLVLEFSPPLKFGRGQDMSRLELREPTAGQVRFAEQHLNPQNGARGNNMYMRTLLSKCGKAPEEAIAAMPMRQFDKAADYVRRFIEDGLQAPADLGDTHEIVFNFDPPLKMGSGSGERTWAQVVVSEPTLAQMMTADSVLGDRSPMRVRMFQIQLVGIAAGAGNALVAEIMPISVLNRAAVFCMGFTDNATATAMT